MIIPTPCDHLTVPKPPSQGVDPRNSKTDTENYYPLDHQVKWKKSRNQVGLFSDKNTKIAKTRTFHTTRCGIMRRTNVTTRFLQQIITTLIRCQQLNATARPYCLPLQDIVKCILGLEWFSSNKVTCFP